MSGTPEAFMDLLAKLRDRLVEQGQVVREMAEAAFESVYARDAERASAVVTRDDDVDKVDIEVEQQAVELMVQATCDGPSLSAADVRQLLTVVKVNNELERIADACSTIAEQVVNLSDRQTPLPKTTRVMTNSVIGIIGDTVKAFRDRDSALARVVLLSEDAVVNFNKLILRDAEERVADGRMSVDLAFDLHTIASQSVLMADHCTNIAEQVIYEATGAIVRHTGGAWVDLPLNRPADT